MTKNTKINFAFFGSSRFSVIVLDELEKAGFVPSLIITTPDKPRGRKMQVTPTPVKTWAQARNITAIESLNEKEIIGETRGAEVFVVASFGKIIPSVIIDIPPRKTLNIHPSLLPKYRGASPLQSAMLDDARQTGISIMRIDEKMDHGPIVAQREIVMGKWPAYEDFESLMATNGAELLASILPDWVAGKIPEKEQDHSSATYTKKIKKEDGLIDLNDDQYLNFRKIQAYHEWPQAYFMIDHRGKKLRVKIASASFTDGKLIFEKVIPEDGKEISYRDFTSGYLRSKQ